MKILWFAAIVLLAGCTTPAPPPVAIVPAAPPTVERRASEGRLLIESEPSGATVVANNQPVGRTPLQLSVAVTPQGFFRDYVAVKVRFVAGVTGEVSRTVEADFTPREKVPQRVIFTVEGKPRVMP